ncbi:hypothetical protein [Phytomonospora endophytica]|uniref:Uncharacterized protein n=1 Tax=Phytomonospora endophytica TaxID=714109 RepID=A0A841FLA2_9ACTN|nr:hypothetical protein [Phytomonospora endophytica]MBB6033967.1 hypothetical protein [Phytomonospora endophytica]GIG64512.1 hypothetical protein Pen01_08070 [Phytomonospora endophytica]
MTGLNVRVRLLRTRIAPGAPVLTTRLTIWWRGTRFRIHDESGRAYADLAADVSEPRGFGRTPRTMEEFMDAATAVPDRGRTDLYGDLDEPVGLVDEPRARPWEVPVARIAPIAAQVLAGDLDGQVPGGRETVLGRECVEYLGVLEGNEGGRAFRSEVRRLVSGPYVLLREVVDLDGGLLRLRAEAASLDEGAVTASDVDPPG